MPRINRGAPPAATPATSTESSRDPTTDATRPRPEAPAASRVTVSVPGVADLFAPGGSGRSHDVVHVDGQPALRLGPGNAMVNTRVLANSWQPMSPATALGGLKIAGLDLSKIDSGRLKLSFPLRQGTFLIPTKNEDARTRVREDASVVVDLQVGRGEDGKPRITSARLDFEPQVTILNPASSLQPTEGSLGGLWDWIQDIAGDVHIDAIDLQADGTVRVDGTVDQPWPLRDKPLSEQVPEGTFPKLNMDLQAVADGRAIAVPAIDDGKPAPGLNTLLASLGAITEQGLFELDLVTEKTRLTATTAGLAMRSDECPLCIDIDGQVELGADGVLKLTLPDDPDLEVQSGVGSADLTGTVTVRPDPKGGIEGSASLLTRANIDGISGTVMPTAHTEIPLEIRGAGNLLVGRTAIGFDADSVVVKHGSATATLRADLADVTTLDLSGTRLDLYDGKLETAAGFSFNVYDGVLAIEDGDCDVKITSSDAAVRNDQLHVRVGGDAEVKVHGERIKLDAGASNPSAQGNMRFVIVPDGFRRANTPIWGEVGYALEQDGTLKLLPTADGITEFVAPFTNIKGNPANLVDPKQPAVGRAGSAMLKAHVSELCDTTLRADNKATLLVDGVMSRQERLRMIRSAQESICLQTLIFKDDETGLETANELIKAAQRGVSVRVIIDAMGNVEKPVELAAGKPLYKMLHDGGVQVKLYNDPRTSELGNLLNEVFKDPEIAAIDDISELMNNPVKALELMQRIARVAAGQTSASPETAARVADALERVMDEAEPHAPTASTARIAAMAAGNQAEAGQLLTTLRLSAALNNRWHEKYLVVDGKVAVTGGMNIADEYLLGGSGRKVLQAGVERTAWRDTDIATEGPAAADVYADFARNWHAVSGQDMPPPPSADKLAIAADQGGGVEMQIIQHHPRLDGDHHITNFMIENLKALEPGEKALIANAYFLPTGALTSYKQALIDAARRGVEVHIVTNSETTNDLPQINQAALRAYEELLDAGVRIYERTGDRTMHTKAAVFGGNTAAIGSWNADNRSAALNSESVTVAYGEDFGAQVESMIMNDLAPGVARELDLAQVRERIRKGGLEHAVAGLFADLM